MLKPEQYIYVVPFKSKKKILEKQTNILSLQINLKSSDDNEIILEFICTRRGPSFSKWGLLSLYHSQHEYKN